jgi:hypothetical protein
MSTGTTARGSLSPHHLSRQLRRRLQSLAAGARTYRSGLALVVTAAPLTATAYLAMLVLLSLVPIAQVWLVKALIDRLALARHAMPATMASILSVAAVYALTLVAMGILAPVQQAVSITLQDRTVAEVDRRLIRTGAQLVDLAHIERPAFQDELGLLQFMHYLPLALFQFLQSGVGIALTLGGCWSSWPACSH